MKRKISVLLISTMMLGAIPVFASDVDTEVAVDEVTTQLPSDVDVYTDETTGETVYELELDGTQDVETYSNNYLAVDDNVSSNNGSYSTWFETTSTFDNFRLFFDSTTATPVNIVIDGPRDYDDYISTIASNGQITLPQNNVPSGRYDIGLTTSDGRAVKGILQVRVSDTPL